MPVSRFRCASLIMLVAASTPTAGRADVITAPDSLSLGTTVYVAENGLDRVGTYNSSTGAAINANFITGVNFQPTSLALDGAGNLFVANEITNTVAKYNATTGALISANFISGLSFPTDIATDSSGNLYVVNHSGTTIGKYSTTTGSGNASFISGLQTPESLAVDNSGHLYVTNVVGSQRVLAEYSSINGSVINASLNSTNFSNGFGGLAVDNSNKLYNGSVSSPVGVGLFDSTTGAAINANFVSTTSGPRAETLDFLGDLYVSNGSVVGKYDASSGTVINASFISGLNTPWGVAVASVPEPSSLCLLGVASLIALGIWRSRRQVVAKPACI